MKDNPILDFYDDAKEYVIRKGYQDEIEITKSLREPKDALEFFYQYVWVVLNSGMKNEVATTIYNNVFGKGGPHIALIGHPGKRRAILKVYNNLGEIFAGYQDSNDKIAFLETLPFIGKITKYHLARNFGMDTAKPDRHLSRLAKALNYNSVQQMCEDISSKSGDRVGVVDVVLWRYCNLRPREVHLRSPRLKKI